MKNERCQSTEEKVERRKLNLESNRRLRNFAPLLRSLTQAQWLRGSSTALQLQVYIAPLRILRLNGSVALESSFCTSSGSRNGKITLERDRGLRGALGSGTRPTQRRSTVRCVECERTHWCIVDALTVVKTHRHSSYHSLHSSPLCTARHVRLRFHPDLWLVAFASSLYRLVGGQRAQGRTNHARAVLADE